ADIGELARRALASEPSIRLRWGPNASWDPANVAVVINAGIEAIDACPFFVKDIDMDIDVEIRASVSVPTESPDVLRTHMHITGHAADVVEELGCAVTAALLWPFVGPILLKDEDEAKGIGVYLAGLAFGPLVTFIAIIWAIETKT